MPLYFAFGSNMDAAQMRARCPGAAALGRATLANHRLVFRGPSQKRGGGVLSVDEAVGPHVEGVLYELSEADLSALDRFEGAPAWYKREEREVCQEAREGSVSALIYRLPRHVQEMPPTEAYVAQVAAAFEALGLQIDALDDAVARAKEAT